MFGIEMDFPMIPSERDKKILDKQVAQDRFTVVDGKKEEDSQDESAD